MATDDDKRKNRLGLSLPAADPKNKNEDDEHTGVDKETDDDHTKRECPGSLKGQEKQETKVTAQKVGPGTKKYRVTGSPIAPFGNKRSFGPEARMYMPGEVVNLTAAQAKHYVNQRRLEPYIDDEE